GPEARGFRPGQRVMALLPGGGYAEEAVVHHGSALPVPETMSDEEAGAFPEVFLTAFSNLFMPGLGALAPGEAALVHGAGAPGGRLVLIGLMGGAQGEVNLAQLLLRRLAVIGSTLRGRSVADKARIVEGFRARFGAALAAGRLRAPIDRVLPLARAAEAHRLMQSSAHFGKIVLRVA